MTKRQNSDDSRTFTLEDLCTKTPHHLDKLASLFSLAPYELRYPQGAIKLKHNIYNFSLFLDRFEKLNPDQLTVFHFFCQHPGKPILPDTIYRELTARLSVTKVNTALSALIRTGWIICFEKPQAFLVLAEVTHMLPHLEPFKQFLNGKAPEDTAPLAGAHWLDDMLTLAAFCFLEQPKITNKGIFAKAGLRKLASSLSPYSVEDWEAAAEENAYPKGLGFLLKLLAETHCAKKIQGSNGAFLQLSQPDWDDFSYHLEPAGRLLSAASVFLQSVRFNMQLWTAFNDILSGWQGRPGWVTATSLLSLVGTNEQPIFQHSDPLSREVRLAHTFLEQLSYLGLVERTEVNLPVTWLNSATSPRLFWRLSALGKTFAQWFTRHSVKHNPYILTNILGNTADIARGTYTPQARELLQHWQDLLPIPLEKELIVQPDLSVIIPRNSPPDLIWLLSVTADLEQQEYVYRGCFSKTKLISCLKMGLELDWLLDSLAEQCKIPAADSVLRTLSDWSAGFDKTLFANVLLLACETPEIASELLAQSKLKDVIIGQAGAKTLIIQQEGEGTVRRWLEKKGWVPRPGIASGHAVATWLRKRE